MCNSRADASPLVRTEPSKEFVRYEMVRIADAEGGKPPRFSIYGFRPDGLRVKVDTLYLRDAPLVRTERAEEPERLDAAAVLREARDLRSEIAELDGCWLGHSQCLRIVSTLNDLLELASLVGARAPQTDQRGHYDGCHLYDPKEVGARAPQEWQPIETAPKDGSHILAWRDSGVHLMRWREQVQRWDEWHVGIKHLTIQPTHWMPLPAPPDHAPRVSAAQEEEQP